MYKKYTFLSVLTTDDYLPGLLVLNASLKNTHSMYPFIVLLSSNISKKTIKILIKNSINFSVINTKIVNSTDINKEHRWFTTYFKLNVFNQTNYDKIVYLDCDILILKNIDDLFEYPHMSATNAGGMLPEKSHWTHMNSGVFIIEPSESLFKDMFYKIGNIEKLKSQSSVIKSKYGSDQDFLNAYYPDWSKRTELHLDHKYNMFHYYLDEYQSLFGYTLKGNTKPVSIIHYASYLKPWHIKNHELSEIKNNIERKLELEAIKLWKDYYNELTQ